LDPRGDAFDVIEKKKESEEMGGYLKWCVAGVAGLAMTAAVSAVDARVNYGNVELDISGPEMTDIFDTGSEAWSGSELAALHEALNDAGIVTRRRVTVLVGFTAEGPSVMTLVDGVWDSANTTQWQLGFSSSSAATAHHRMNNLGEDVAIGAGSADGTFKWRSGNPDAFAWTGLVEGDTSSFDLSWGGGTGLSGNKPVQFVSYDDKGVWSRVKRANFDEAGEFSYDVTIVPSPAAAVLIGVAALVARRRRRAR
jgi:hypothetical protein